MSVSADVALFVAGAAVSLATSWVLVTRLERLGERLGVTEATLGLIAALAADTPEITASITALAHNQRDVGAGVVIGSNVFNLAALLGLGAIVAGRIDLHRRVVVFAGTVAMWIALVCLVTMQGVVAPGVGVVLTCAIFVPYVVVIGCRRRTLDRLPMPPAWISWLSKAVEDEELELEEAIRPPVGRPVDTAVAILALCVVITASIVMERSATSLGAHFSVPGLIIGGIVLAAVTSLPNAVSAVYLAAKGRGAATLSTALNSNSINVLLGLLVPAVVLGISGPSGPTTLIGVWFVALTLMSLVLAYVDRGLRRASGWIVVASYGAFVAALFAVT